MVLNLETRRPVRIPQEVLDTRLQDRPHVTVAKNNRMRPFTDQGREKEIIVRRSDLDMNNHVNNVRYIEWMLETIDQEMTQKIRNLDIQFMRESFVDDRLKSASLEDGNLIRFKILNNKDEIIALAEATL
jgi:acyl-ACP thioesterase